MKIIKVDVTLEDIAQGFNMDGDKCPIAIALIRACGEDATYVDVGAEEVQITHSDRETRMRGILPPEAQHFVRLFDGRHPVSPFSFEVLLTN